MPQSRHIVDQQTIDYYIRRAHAERADAFASAFAVIARQIKSAFSSPDAGPCPGRLSPRA